YPTPTRPSKRGLSEILSEENTAPLFSPRKRFKGLSQPLASTTIAKSKHKAPSKGKSKTLTQLHFNIDQSILRTCSLCDLSYTKGAPDDEALHRAHCTRVRQGMEWGREQEQDRMRGTENVVIEVKADIKLKANKKKGRIICFPADIESRERIVGCVIAQRISTAMAVVPPAPPSSPSASTQLSDCDETAIPIPVDAETNLFCSPTPLPTPMGISRLFVSSSHRRLGIAQALLDASAATFIHGCPLSPRNGQVAFSQPTGMGQAVMKNWGKGGVRVFEE
ncbi:hypothetical protein BDZ97DRAFT_1825464, partial [Flammula alnicola]